MTARRSGADGPTGVVIVDKPADWTSHDVVARLRRLAGTRKVGHAGTLDPMATGVLVCGLGRATRLLTYLVGADKTYTATIRLGAATVTDDAEGDVTSRTHAGHLTRQDVVRAVGDLTGDILQVPSAVSAVKVEGRRSYARVRSGEQVALAARPVTVHAFTVLETRHHPDEDSPDEGSPDEGSTVLDVDVEVRCSSGTYVRALARDLGAALGVGGHLTVLRRTAVGPFDLSVALTLDELAEDLRLVPLAQVAAAALPVRTVDAGEAAALGHGQQVAPLGLPGPAAAIGPDGELVAVLQERDGAAWPVVVLKPA